MKISKYLKLILILLLVNIHSNGQNSISIKQAEYKRIDGEKLFQRLNNYGYTHQTERNQLDSLNLSGFTFMRFKLDEQGKIKDIIFNVGTPLKIMKYMENALNWTQGYWLPKSINGKPVESDYMLLPVTYILGNDTTDESEIYKSFWRMLWFDGSDDLVGEARYKRMGETLNCVLLHPYFVKTGIH